MNGLMFWIEFFFYVLSPNLFKTNWRYSNNNL